VRVALVILNVACTDETKLHSCGPIWCLPAWWFIARYDCFKIFNILFHDYITNNTSHFYFTLIDI
jgi:hypothetical protein